MSIVILETERYAVGDGDAFIKLTLPRLNEDGCALEKNFSSYYGNLKRGFDKYVNAFLAPSAAKRQGAPYGASVNTVLCCETDRLLSLYTDVLLSDGKGTRQGRRAVLWDKSTGNVIDPKNLFVKGAKKRIISLLQEELQLKSEKSAVPLYGDALSKLKSQFKWENFYLSPDSVIFFCEGNVLCQGYVPYPIPVSYKRLEEFFTIEALENLSLT